MLVFAILCGLLIVADQAAKYCITVYFPLHTGMAVVPGFFNLIHVHNTGGAFSIFAGADPVLRKTVFIALTIVILVILVFAYWKAGKGDYPTRAAYILIAGGAAGNLVDRIRMGEVIDFLDFYAGTYHWPAFNVADSAISVGALLLLASLIRGK
jgi:signal peptidase II